MSVDNSTTGAEDSMETFEVASYYRPLTRSARSALQEYGIIDERSNKQEVDDPYTVVEVSERPDRDILEQHELDLLEDPEEVWETDRGKTIHIYRDRVEVEGRESSMGVAEAKERCQSEGRFTRKDN